MDGKRTPKRVSEWKPIDMRIRRRPRKRWIEGTEKDIQIMRKDSGESNVNKEQNGRESLSTLKLIASCRL
jgi:hypothetical protein